MHSPDLVRAPAAPDRWRTLAALSAALLALALLWAASGEARTVAGVPVWLKPAKFAASLALLFGTIALVADRLSPAVREGRALRVTGWVMGTAMIAEMAYIIAQGARARGSHYNLDTPFEAIMYGTVMAAGAVSLVVGVGVIGWIARRDAGAWMGPALREGVWLGFALAFVLTLIVAGTMSMGTGPHVGVHPEGAPVLPFVGWSGVTGDLRPAHFLSLHAMQALPLLGLWLDGRDRPGRVGLVRWAALGWTGLVAAVFAQALMGLPLVALG